MRFSRLITLVVIVLFAGLTAASSANAWGTMGGPVNDCGDCPPQQWSTSVCQGAGSGENGGGYSFYYGETCGQDYQARLSHCAALNCGGDSGGGNTGGGNTGGGGLSQEQINAIAAVLEALQNARNYAGDAATQLTALNNLYSSLAGLQTSLSTHRGQVTTSLTSIRGSLSLVAGYLSDGKKLGPKGLAIIERQLATAVAERVAANVRNNETQGCTVGDPVLVASGFESYSEEDFSYTSVNDIIKIARQFRSNKTDLVSSFGTSWFFNYDTKVVAGRKPHIKERELLTIELQEDAQELADLAVAAMNDALDKLETAQTAAENARQKANEIAILRDQIQAKHDAVSSAANQAQTEADTASTQAGIAGTDEASSNAALAAQAASSANGSKTTAASKLTLVNTASGLADTAATDAEADVVLAEADVADIEEKESAIQGILDKRIADAAVAAAEARQEEETYPLDPYPADPTVYFGPGYVKIFTEEGTPIVFQEKDGEEGHYFPVSDNGSYTDEIVAIENGFKLVTKQKETREFGHNGKGLYFLSRTTDTNNNSILFARTGDKLDEITDAVGRKTTFTYNTDGFISLVIDPEGDEHRYSYIGSQLSSYTDPMGYVYSYSYDQSGRMTSRIDPMGAAHSYVYDEQGRVVTETDKEGFQFNYLYDPENRTTKVTDRRGLVTTYFYNESNRLERTLYPDGSEVSNAYDGRNNVVAVSDENGNISYLNYNENNDVTTTINALGERTDITYEPNFNKVSFVTDARGFTRTFSYDASGNLVGITHPDGTYRTISYNAFGLPASVTDENGNTTSLIYNSLAQLVRTTYADGSHRDLTQDIVGRVTAVTDELGNTTTFVYNPLGSLLSTVDPIGAETSFEYDALQRKTSAVNALGNATDYEYSLRGDLLSETDPLGQVVSYEYDGEGNMLKKTFPNNTGIDFGYDARSRVVEKITFPGNLETVYVYDAKGQKISEQDANGNTTSFTYDIAYRPTGKIDATGSTTTAEYDPAGNVIRVADGNGNPISYTYDEKNRLISQSNALGNTTNYWYDGIGNLIRKQNPDGAQIEYNFDSRNRLTAVFYPDGTEKSFSYDMAGRMVGMANEETSETREYDARGLLVSTTDYYNGRVDYGYDVLGNRISMIDPDSGEFSYAYDEKNRLISFTDPEGKVTSYVYDVLGRVISTDLPNNTRTIQAYNNDNRLESMVTTSDKDGVLASFEYSYDNVGNKLSMTEETGVTSYQYDAAYRLVHVQYPEIAGASGNKNNGSNKGKGKKNGHNTGSDPVPTSVSYVYDAAGNRLSKSDDILTIEYSYNAANQLLQAGGTSYAYDANGNRVSKQDDEGTSYYLYNHDNFLVQFEDPEDVTAYGYDAMNRRIYKSQGDKKKDVTAYLYDGLDVLQEVTGNNANKVTAYYRANGRIITQQQYNVSQGNNNQYQNRPEGKQLFYAYDGLGSVAALSNHQGKAKTRYQYDAFGKVLAGDLSDNPYAFTGQRFDPESNLYHFHFRQYDAEVGVWTTADPIGILGGMNVYEYVEGNPINRVDMLGLKCQDHRDSSIKKATINFAKDVWDDFKTTNKTIGVSRSLVTLGFGGSFAKQYGGYTAGQYIFGGPAKHLGSHRATLNLVARTSMVNTALVTASLEAGILAGSILNVLGERAYDAVSNYVEKRDILAVDSALHGAFDDLDEIQTREGSLENGSRDSGNSGLGDRESSPGGSGGV